MGEHQVNPDQQVRFQLVCTRCGAVHSIDVQNNWGRSAATSGLGPRPVCPALVPSGRDDAEQVCRGMLAPQVV